MSATRFLLKMGHADRLNLGLNWRAATFNIQKNGFRHDLADFMGAGDALHERQLVQEERYCRAMKPVAQIVFEFRTKSRIEIDSPGAGEPLVDQRPFTRSSPFDHALLHEARKREVPRRHRGLPRRVDEGVKCFFIALVPDDRSTFHTVRNDLVLVTELQYLEFSGTPEGKQALDGLMGNSRVIVDKDGLKTLVKASEIFLVEIGNGAGHDFVHP